MVDALFTPMGRWGRLSNYKNPKIICSFP